MIKRVTVEGFRGFDKMTVGPLGDINLILGRNNVGKSTLLESLFLLSGPTNPEVPLKLSGLRGIEQIRNDPEEMWGWLFNRKDISKPIELTASLDNGKSCSLTIKLIESRLMNIPGKRGKNNGRVKSFTLISTADKPRELEFRYKNEKGVLYVTSAVLKESNLEFKRDNAPLKLPDCIYVSGRSGYSSENAEKFSKLQEVGKEEELLPAFQNLEPRLKKLAVLVTGSGPVIHCDLALGHMVPMHFMGEGIGRLMTILLALTSCPGGTVLIDEIEMGLHYSAMVDAWRAIAEIATKNKVQVFATTHNWECLQAGHTVFNEKQEIPFSVHRLDREGESIVSTEFTSEMIETALQAGLEVR